MEKHKIFVLYHTGEVLDLNQKVELPGSEIAAFIKCEYAGPARENEPWSYSVYDNLFNILEHYSFEWHGFKCTIAKEDNWLYPLEDWNGNYHQWMRIKTSVSKIGSKPININLRHVSHAGEAFRTLSRILLIAEKQGLIVAKEEFRALSKKEPGA